MKILIIEDSKAEAHILAQTLKRILDTRPSIRHVATLGEAAVVLEEEHASLDLVFLDLKLSDSPEWRDTYEAVAPYAKKVPIIVMSGHDDEAIKREVIIKGAEDYIVKGGKKRHVDMLKETIDFALCRHKAVRDLAEAVEQEAQCVHWLTGGYTLNKT